MNKKHDIQAVRHILTALPYGSVAVFYQTDVRLPTEGQVSKAFLVLKAAEEVPEASGTQNGFTADDENKILVIHIGQF